MPNLRFGASEAVTPQKRQCELGSEYPARTAVEAPPAPSRRVVVGKFEDSATLEKNAIQNNQKKL